MIFAHFIQHHSRIICKNFKETSCEAEAHNLPMEDMQKRTDFVQLKTARQHAVKVSTAVIMSRYYAAVQSHLCVFLWDANICEHDPVSGPYHGFSFLQ